MKNIIKKLFYSILILFILTAGLVTFALSTTPGLYAVIKLSRLYLPGHLKVHQLSGRLIDGFSIGELDYQDGQLQIKINKLRTKWTIHFFSNRQIIIKNILADAIEIKNYDDLHLLNHIKITGLINPQKVVLDTIQANYFKHKIRSRFQMELSFRHTVLATVNLNPNNSNQNIMQGSINLDGDYNQLQWTGNIHGPLSLSFNGTLKENSRIHQVIKWREFNLPTDEGQSIHSPEGRITVSGVLPQIKIKVTTKINNAPKDYWQFAANVDGILPYSWNFDAHLSRLYSGPNTTEGLYTRFNLKGMLKDSNQGTCTLTIHPGRYQMSEIGIIPYLPFDGGLININLTPKSLVTKGSIAIDQSKKINLNAEFPDFDLNELNLEQQKIKAELTMVFSSLAFLKDISPEIKKLSGSLHALLKAEGTLSQVVTQSQLDIKHVAFNLPKLGINIDDLDLNFRGKKEGWTTRASLASAGKKLLLKGKGQFNADKKGRLQLTGSDFMLVNTKEYQIKISPNLNINLSPSLINITGEVLVPYAQIKPVSFDSSQGLSEDVVFKKDLLKKETSPPVQTSLDIKVSLGDQVELNVKGLQGSLEGMIHLKQIPQGSINADGELSIKKGMYKAYGQNLTIERGQVIYTGGPLDNPGINLRAAKTVKYTNSPTSSNQLFDVSSGALQGNNFGKLKVGVEVSGRLSAPKVTLFSIPAVLSQADILSMLVLGRPASQANKAGGQILLAAISSMNFGGDSSNATKLLEQFKENYGIDFNIQTTTNYNQQTNQTTDSTALVVSKTLSKRVTLSYNVGLSQADPNVFTLTYLINKFFSLQISSSENANGIDLLYSRSKDNIK